MIPLHFFEIRVINTVRVSYVKSSAGIQILDTILPDCASRTL